MRTKCAPTYASTNTLMSIFEETHNYPSKTYECFTRNVCLIDDDIKIAHEVAKI